MCKVLDQLWKVLRADHGPRTKGNTSSKPPETPNPCESGILGPLFLLLLIHSSIPSSSCHETTVSHTTYVIFTREVVSSVPAPSCLQLLCRSFLTFVSTAQYTFRSRLSLNHSRTVDSNLVSSSSASSSAVLTSLKASSVRQDALFQYPHRLWACRLDRSAKPDFLR